MPACVRGRAACGMRRATLSPCSESATSTLDGVCILGLFEQRFHRAAASPFCPRHDRPWMRTRPAAPRSARMRRPDREPRGVTPTRCSSRRQLQDAVSIPEASSRLQESRCASRRCREPAGDRQSPSARCTRHPELPLHEARRTLRLQQPVFGRAAARRTRCELLERRRAWTQRRAARVGPTAAPVRRRRRFRLLPVRDRSRHPNAGGHRIGQARSFERCSRTAPRRERALRSPGCGFTA